MNLANGEALLFCPAAYLDVDKPVQVSTLKPLRSSYVKIKIRNRVTEDGGRSIMVNLKSLERQEGS